MQPEHRALVVEVEEKGRALCESIKAAGEAGVPDALLLPALLAVFREAGMLPDIDLSMLTGLLR